MGAVLLVASAAAACGAGRADVAALQPDGGPAGADGAGTLSPPRPLSQPAEDASLPSPADFADVNIPIDFTDPVSLPPPTTDIAGDLTDLVGSWIEVDSSGQPCTAPATGGVPATECTHLDIQRGADGAFSGTVYHDHPLPGTICTAGTNMCAPMIAGPFPPATDPTVGYPPTVSPSDYGEIELNTVAGVHYRILDGALIDSTFTFWISPLDVWSDWCALQSSSLWNVNGKQEYQCVPQTADASNTDPGKLALCTPASAACECSASACRAALRSDVVDATFQLQSGKLMGVLGQLVSSPMMLAKVTP